MYAYQSLRSRIFDPFRTIQLTPWLCLLCSMFLFDVTSVQAQTIPMSINFDTLPSNVTLQLSDTVSWKIVSDGGVSNSYCLRSNRVTDNSGDGDTAFFTAIQVSLTGGYTYHAAFQTKAKYDNGRKAVLAINTIANRASSTVIEDFGTITSTSSYQSYGTDFSVATSGTYYLIYYGINLSNHIYCNWYTDDFSITVVNTPPTATLTGPANNGYYNPGQTVYFTATGTDAESNISKIEFYSGSIKVAEDATPSSGVYAATWVPDNGGAHTLTAKAVDSYGLTGTSSSRTINVRELPVATITNLEYHGDYYESNQPVTATATDNDGTIQYVVFYRGTDSIGIDSTSPYQMVVPLVYDEFNPSTYIVSKAVDDDGLEGIAAVPINILPNPCTLTTPNELLKQTICSGDSIHLSGSAEGAESVRWLQNLGDGGWTENTSSTNRHFYVKQPGLYTAEWTFSNAAVCTTAVDTVDFWRPNTHFIFDSLACRALLSDSLEDNLQSVLITPGAGSDSAEFFYTGTRFQYEPVYSTTGRHELLYKVKDVNTGCTVGYPLAANWSDLRVQVPPVYVNHALTSYGLAIGSQGAPWHTGNDKYTYQWFKSGAPYATGNQMSAPDTLGPYFVVATDSLGCHASDTLTYVYRDMYSTKSIWVKNQSYDTVRIGWDSLTSVNHMVVVREGSRIDWVPEQGKGYSVNNEFGTASLGGGYFGVFIGTGGAVNVKGLVPNKNYYVAIYAWKIAGGDTLWDTTHVQRQFKTKEISVPKTLEIPHITGHNVRLKWVRKPGLGVILAGREDDMPTASPVDSTDYEDSLSYAYTGGTLSDGSKILYKGTTADSVIVGDLDSNEVYNFKMWYYRSQDGNDYYGTNGKTVSIKTNLLAPDSLRLEPDSGFAFDYVLVKGSQLTGVDKVKCGGKLVDFKFVTDKSIKFKVPVGEEEKDVFVRRNGTWYESETPFRYLAISQRPPQPDPASISCESTMEVPPIIDPPPVIDPPQTFFGNRNTPSGPLTILVVFTRLTSETEIIDDPTNSIVWPNPNVVPNNMDEISYSDFNEISEVNQDLTLSNFYFQMSRSNPKLEPFQVIFKPFPVVLIRDSPIPITEQIESFYENHPELVGDLANFDTRTTGGSFTINNINSLPDGVFDMEIHMQGGSVWVPNSPGFGGSANGILGINHFTVAGKTYTLGSNAVNTHGFAYFGWELAKGTITHELSHYLWASPHVFYNNNTVGSHYNSTHGWGTMAFNYRANLFESWVQGWSEVRSIQNQSETNSGPFFIHDFTRYYTDPPTLVTAVNGLRIEIPGSKFNGSSFNIVNSKQNLWISNYAGISEMDRVPVDDFHAPSYDNGSGIIMMIDAMEVPTRNLNISGNIYSRAAALKFLHPNGGVDLIDADYSDHSDLLNRDQFHIFPNIKVIRKNPFSMNSQATIPRMITPYTNPSLISHNSDFNCTGCIYSPVPNDIIVQRYLDGVLNRGYDFRNFSFANGAEAEELGLNFDVPVFNHQIFNQTFQEISPIILNGIYVKIYPKDGDDPNQLREVEVSYNENTLSIDKLFTGHFHLTNIVSGSDLIVGEGKELRLDKPHNPNRTTKGPNNLYPDFITPSRFICKTGSLLELESNSKFIVENESAFVLETGSSLILGAGAELIIRPGCTFHALQGCYIDAGEGSKIILEDNSYYCIDPDITYASENTNIFRLGLRLGHTSPKLNNALPGYQYLPVPSNCVPIENFPLSFSCNSILIGGPASSFTLQQVGGSEAGVSSPFSLSGKTDGEYHVISSNSTGLPGSYQSTFHLYGQSGAVSWTTDDARSFSNLLILNNNLSVSDGSIILEPKTQVYIKGTVVTPTCPEPGFCPGYITGGDITLSGTAKLDVREAATLQGMCGTMWGGISISGNSLLSAYNNMIFKDSYDGIDVLADEDAPGLMQLHVFNARFENNYRSVKQTDAIDAFNFIRNSTFTSDPDQMKAPFNKPSPTSCNRFISRTHVEYDHCQVKYGNFWNNDLSKAQNGLEVSNSSRGFNSVKNRFSSNYGKSIYLHAGSAVPLNFDQDQVTLPDDQLFCNASGETPPDYIVAPTPYSKYGFYVEGSSNLPVINKITISGPSNFGTSGSFRNVGIYAHGASSTILTQSTLQNLNYGMVFYGSTVSGTKHNTITENLFANNEQNLRFKSNYEANFKVRLNCNKFEYPSGGASPFTKRYGIYVEDGANLPDIGGTGANDADYPAGNWWPRGTSSGNNIATWTSPADWKTVHNESANNWKYFGYQNEFIADIGAIEEVSGDGIFATDQTTVFIISNLNNPTLTNTYPGATLLPRDCFNFGTNPVFPTREAVSQTEDLAQTPDSIQKSHLLDPVPNPAGKSTVIAFVLDEDALKPVLEIFEISTGRIIRRIGLMMGKGSVEVGLSSFNSGIYGCRLVSDGRFIDLKRLSVVH